MAHGGYENRRVKPTARRSKALGTVKKPKSVSLKNQIRSVERMLRKNLPPEVREAQENKLDGLIKQQEIHTRLAAERKIFLRDRKIKFFERRKIERRIRRLEKLQRTSSGQAQGAEFAEQLSKHKEDLQYVTYFPKTEKYVPLFTGGDTSEILDSRNRLRKQIKARLIDAAANGKDLEETGSEDDGLLDLSEDDFFLTGSSSDEDADDEWTDKSTREQASSASGKAVSGMSSDERNQRQISARALMPPPRPSNKSSSVRARSRFGSSSSQNSSMHRAELSTSSNTSNSRSRPSFKAREASHSKTGHGSNLSSNSDAHKPRRKRRPKKKKKQAS
ncbi:rRNA-processing protein EFG1 [Quillaja saponaria]|uniref:rRNA-processing protein EFG1 n=1 Tax=Quillaja saponaria TaxID=32244 RepID=A0AAD7LB02_QUISA|nr:rRNA-processing protein EFG1 [Quillaja saponaria]